MGNNWISIGDELPPDGRQVDFYSPEWDEVFCGVRHGDKWFDETRLHADNSPEEVLGVTHWRHRPKKPFAE